MNTSLVERFNDKKTVTRLLLAVILLVAAVLRLWKFDELPFVHDEFSALLRTDFDSFGDLIRNGVMVDAHPAGVQVFLYYWVKLFGWNEFWIKLPFALMGIGSIYFAFRIAQRWFGDNTALLTAALLTVSQYTIYYSQIARPYSPGLFFVLLFVFFWNRMIFDKDKPSTGTCIGFALSTWAAAMTHNFAIAEAGLIFVTGLFVLPKDRRKQYWLSGVAALLLFAPNFPVFYHQLFVDGGIGGWLGRPEPIFAVDFLYHTINNSKLMLFAVLGIVVLPGLFDFELRKFGRMQAIALVWFVLPLVVAYVYSLLREPVLQFSTLYFGFPFLVMVLFSLYDEKRITPLVETVLVGLILLLGSAALISERHYYDYVYHQGYDQMAISMKRDAQVPDVAFAAYSDNVRQVEFYQQKQGVEGVMNYSSQSSLSAFADEIARCGAKHLGFGWTDYADPKWELAAVAYYPYLIRSEQWFNSKYQLLATEGDNCLLTVFENSSADMNGNEWGNVWTLDMSSLPDGTDFFGAVAEVEVESDSSMCLLVTEVRNAADEVVLWHSSDDVVVYRGKTKLCSGFRLDGVEGSVIRTYVWNRSANDVRIESVKWYAPEREEQFFGIFRP